jgi:hypothetical protein
VAARGCRRRRRFIDTMSEKWATGGLRLSILVADRDFCRQFRHP